MSNVLDLIGKRKFRVLGILERIDKYLDTETNKSLKIYACDARTLYLYYRRNKYLYVSYNNSDIILPDGRPIYWLINNRFQEETEHITGPNLMQSVLNSSRLKAKRHMFYGGTTETIELLAKKCLENGVNLVYWESPPFLSIDNLEVSKVGELIQSYDIDFFWCGLGAPKQEFMIHKLNLDKKVVLLGVGLAFDYYAGTVKKASPLLSYLGLEWVSRYLQQPKRIKRFIKPFFFVFMLLIKEFLIPTRNRKL